MAPAISDKVDFFIGYDVILYKFQSGIAVIVPAGAADTATPQPGVVVDVGRREPAPFDEEYFYSEENDGYSYQNYG